MEQGAVNLNLSAQVMRLQRAQAGPEGDVGLWTGCKDRKRLWVVSLELKQTRV